ARGASRDAALSPAERTGDRGAARRVAQRVRARGRGAGRAVGVRQEHPAPPVRRSGASRRWVGAVPRPSAQGCARRRGDGVSIVRATAVAHGGGERGDASTGGNPRVVVTHIVQEAVFLAGRIVVFGSHPGHVREELVNPLPYPRQERSPEFDGMVDRLHAILTATLLPEPAPAAPQRLIPFPRVHVSEVTGLLDHLLSRPDGKGHVFELAEDLGVDYDRMSAVVRGAEQLGWVTTPGEVVQLTLVGREVMAMDDPARKDATRARLKKHPLFGRVIAMLVESEGSMEDEEVLADLTIYFPFIPADSLFQTIVEWGRYAEVLDHDATVGRLMLTGTVEGAPDVPAG